MWRYVAAGVGGIFIIGGGMLYRYLFDKQKIVLDGVEQAGKTTLLKLLVGEEIGEEHKVTSYAHIKEGRGYAVYDVPGQEELGCEREEATKKWGKEDDMLYIYVFDATNRLKNDDQEKKRFDFALRECEEKGWDFLTIGSRRDKITEEERREIENDSRRKGAECQIFDLRDSQSLGEIENYINTYIKNRKNTK